VQRLAAHYGLPAEKAWEALCRYIPSSDLLAGRKGEWKADLDWVLKPTNLTKIIEGKYDNRQHTTTDGFDYAARLPGLIERLIAPENPSKINWWGGFLPAGDSSQRSPKVIANSLTDFEMSEL
jgi:hypothetical protein